MYLSVGYYPVQIIDLIRGTIFDYVIHFQMAKAHEPCVRLKELK